MSVQGTTVVYSYDEQEAKVGQEMQSKDGKVLSTPTLLVMSCVARTCHPGGGLGL